MRVTWRTSCGCLLSMIVVFASAAPVFVAGAEDVCQKEGYTVVFVNGILTSRFDAGRYLKQLQAEFSEQHRGESLRFSLGYNESHLGGIGDVFQSVTQAFSKPISQHDLKTILMQIHPEVSTQKILLVGHSQGSFYVNEMYQYLIAHGVPKESIAVYHVATPASFVAGGGQYVTSKNDKLINWVRDSEREGNLRVYADSHYTIEGAGVASALRANIEIPPELEHEESEYGGHKFDVYMDGASDRMVRDIGGALTRLKSNPEEPSQCFESPDADITYKMQAAALSIFDPLFESFTNAASSMKQDLANALHGVLLTRGSGLSLFTSSGKNPEILPANSQLAAPVVAFGNQEREPSQSIAPDETSVVGNVAPTVPVNERSSAVESGDVTEGEDIVLQSSSPQEGPAQEIPNLIPALFEVVPGFGGGGGGAPVQEEEQPEPEIPTPSDTTPPATTTLTVLDCAYSLVANSCVVPTDSVALSWDTAVDAVSYAIVINDSVQSVASTTSGTAALQIGITNNVSIVSYDEAGNAATSTSVEVRTVAKPLIINEVGWAGAMTSAFDPAAVPDQWIEIKNISGEELSLEHVSLQNDGTELVTLSGTLPAAALLVVQQTSVPFSGLHSLTFPFTSLSTSSAQQVSIAWNGATIDATPLIGACPSWCAGAAYGPIGSNESGVAGLYSVLSMERVSDSSDGIAASSWRSTDSYGPYIGGVGKVWGTPGNKNSAGLPEDGVYCGSRNLVEMNGPYSMEGGCVYLSRFISGGSFGSNRYGGVYRGSVASSTQVSLHSLGKSIGSFQSETVPADAVTGEEYFFAIWENRSFGNDVQQFNSYFTQGASSTLHITGTPHGNYVTIPWTYSP